MGCPVEHDRSAWRWRFKVTITTLLLFSATMYAAGTVNAADVGGFIGVPKNYDLMLEADCRVCHDDPAIVKPEKLVDRHNVLANAPIPPDTDAPNAGGEPTYECLTCHELIWVQEELSYRFGDFRDCMICHMQKMGQVETVHHRGEEAQSGNCTYCHTTPAFAQDRPAQAACRECHGAFMHDNGGPIQDFGACVSCHNDSFDTAMAPISALSSEFPTYGDPPPFHPAPRDSRGNIRGVGYTRPAAGKGLFALFWAQITNNGQDQEDTFLENIEPNGDDMDDEGGFRWRRPTLDFNLVWINNNGTDYQVPAFPPLMTTTAASSGGSVSSGGGINLALNKSASTSDYEGSSYRASNAVDGSTSSYWRVDSSRSEWLKVDLGQSYRVDKVVIQWGSEFAREYEVQVSANNYSWARVEDQNYGNGGTDEVTFSERDVRYVRVYCTREDDRGYRISELEVYNESVSSSSASSSSYSSGSSYGGYGDSSFSDHSSHD